MTQGTPRFAAIINLSQSGFVFACQKAAKLGADCYPGATLKVFSDFVDYCKLLILLVELARIELATS